MEGVETEQRYSWKRQKLTTRQGVVLGVVAVAGLGLLSKLVSFFRREKPKKVKDSDIHSLEAVVSGDAATPKFANLEEDDAFNGEANGVTHPSDTTGNDDDAVETPTEPAEVLPTEDVERLPTAEEHKLPGSENVGNPGSADAGNGQVEDAEELPKGTHQSVEARSEDVEKQVGGDVEENGKPFVEEAADADTEETLEPPTKDAEGLRMEDEGRLGSEESGEADRAEKVKNLTQNGEELQS